MNEHNAVKFIILSCFPCFNLSVLANMFESVQCENLLKNETAKFQAVYDGFCKEKATHLQALKGTFPVDMVFCQLCHLANRSNKS